MAERKIHGRTVRHSRNSGDEAARLLLRFLKVAGPLQGVIAALAAPEDDPDRQNAIAAALAAMAPRMDDKAFSDLVIDLVSQCTIDGILATPGIMELDELIEVALFAAEDEFGSTLRRFFDREPARTSPTPPASRPAPEIYTREHASP